MTPNTNCQHSRLRAFLSFSTKDKALVDELRREITLKYPNIELLDHVAEENYEKDWKRRCDRKIDQCALVICLLGKSTHKSDAVTWENC